LSKELSYLGAGTILIAEPFAKDAMFGRSVVLICHYDKEGALGLILNKPAANPFEEDPDHPLSRFHFFGGGPMDVNSMFFVHTLPYLKNSFLLKDGICWQGEYTSLLEAMDEDAFRNDNGRLLVGYAGWSENQLETEIANEEWMLYNGPIDFILETDPLQLWKELLQRMGPYYKMVSNFPADPNLN
jgi:putative transcriptional regulator